MLPIGNGRSAAKAAQVRHHICRFGNVLIFLAAWTGGGMNTNSTGSTLAWAYSTKAVTTPADPQSTFQEHDVFGIYGRINRMSRNASLTLPIGQDFSASHASAANYDQWKIGQPGTEPTDPTDPGDVS